MPLANIYAILSLSLSFFLSLSLSLSLLPFVSIVNRFRKVF